MHSVDQVVEFTQHHRPVFVVGMERGGTSIVYKTLAGSPAFGGLKSIAETFAFADSASLLRDDARDMSRQYLGGEAHFQAFREWFGGLSGWPEPWQLPRQTVTSYFYYASQVARKGVRVIEKTPRHSFNVDFMLRCFPKAQIVGILRNPFGVIESYTKRLAREKKLGNPPESWAWLDRSPQQICMHIEKVAAAVMKAKETYKNRVVVLTYEELLRDPDLMVQLLCDWVGIEPVPIDTAEDGEKIKSKTSDPLINQNKIVKGNFTQSSLPTEERIKLVRQYPDLFARCGGISL